MLPRRCGRCGARRLPYPGDGVFWRVSPLRRRAQLCLWSRFFKFLRVAQASSLTESMPRRVSNASLASSQVASSSKLERMLEPVVPMRSSHQVILFVSSPTSPSWNRWSSSANQSDKTCWRWSYFGIAFPMEFILVAEKYFYKIHKFLQDTQKCRRVFFPTF